MTRDILADELEALVDAQPPIDLDFRSDWDESQHPRGPDGKFGEGGPGSGAPIGGPTRARGEAGFGRLGTKATSRPLADPSKTGRELLDTLPKTSAPAGEDRVFNGSQDWKEFEQQINDRTEAAVGDVVHRGIGEFEPVDSAVQSFTRGGGGWYDIRAFERDPAGFAKSHPGQMEAWEKMRPYLSPYEAQFHSAAERDAHYLKQFFEKAAPTPGLVYRGMAADDAKVRALLDHDTLTLTATSSSSRHAEVGMDFAGKHARDEHTIPVVFRLRQRSGVAIEHISKQRGEREVLLPKGTTFQITGRSQSAGTLVIDAEESPRKDAGDWDEERHPRDERGRFGAGGSVAPPGGGPTKARTPGEGHGRTLAHTLKGPRIEPPINPARPVPGEHPKSLDEYHFSATFTQENSGLNVHQVLGLTQHPELSRWLDEQPMNERPRLELLHRTEDIKNADGSGGRTQGLYFPSRMYPDGSGFSTPVIQLAVGAGVPPMPREDFRPWGEVWGVAEHRESIKDKDGMTKGFEGKTPAQFAHDVLLHELGHHIEMGPAASRNESDGAERRIRDVVDNAYAQHGFEKVAPLKLGEVRVSTVGRETLRDRVLDGHAKSPAISRYAATNPREYFAESFNAYISHNDALKEHDPLGHAMVKEVLKRLRIEP